MCSESAGAPAASALLIGTPAVRRPRTCAFTAAKSSKPREENSRLTVACDVPLNPASSATL